MCACVAQSLQFVNRPILMKPRMNVTSLEVAACILRLLLVVNGRSCLHMSGRILAVLTEVIYRFPQTHPGKFCGSTSKLAINTTFYSLSISLFSIYLNVAMFTGQM